jgi:hypothetical protein
VRKYLRFAGVDSCSVCAELGRFSNNLVAKAAELSSFFYMGTAINGAPVNRRAKRRWLSEGGNVLKVLLPDLRNSQALKVSLVDISEFGAMVSIEGNWIPEELAHRSVSGTILDEPTSDRYEFSADIVWVRSRLNSDKNLLGLRFHSPMRFQPSLIAFMMAEGYMS